MRITSKGQVTIPQAIREKYGLLPDTDVEFVIFDGRVTLAPAPAREDDRGGKAVARLRAAVRRAEHEAPGEALVVVGPLSIDLARKRVARDGTDVRLSPTEWAFLEVLARHVGRLVSRQQVLREVWGPGYEKEGHYLRVYMAQLRRKLEDDPAHPRHLVTSAGLGYLLEP